MEKRMNFGQSINYKAPNADRTLVRSVGNTIVFKEFRTVDARHIALLNDGEKVPWHQIGWRPLHERNK